MGFFVRTSRQKEIVDITSQAVQDVSKSGVKDGICLVYVPHATAGIIINEFEPNLESDFLSAFEKLFPKGAA